MKAERWKEITEHDRTVDANTFCTYQGWQQAAQDRRDLIAYVRHLEKRAERCEHICGGTGGGCRGLCDINPEALGLPPLPALDPEAK